MSEQLVLPFDELPMIPVYYAPPYEEVPMTLEEAVTQVLRDVGIKRTFTVRRTTQGIYVIYDDDPDAIPVDPAILERARQLMDIANDTGG